MTPTTFSSLPPELRLELLKCASHISPKVLVTLAATARPFYELYLMNQDYLVRSSITSNVPDEQMLFCIVILENIVRGHKLATGYTASGGRVDERFCTNPGRECLRMRRHVFAHEYPSLYDIASFFPLDNFPPPLYTQKDEKVRRMKLPVVDQHFEAIKRYKSIITNTGGRCYQHLVPRQELISPLRTLLPVMPLIALKKVYALHTFTLALVNGRQEKLGRFPFQNPIGTWPSWEGADSGENFFPETVLSISCIDRYALKSSFATTNLRKHFIYGTALDLGSYKLETFFYKFCTSIAVEDQTLSGFVVT